MTNIINFKNCFKILKKILNIKRKVNKSRIISILLYKSDITFNISLNHFRYTHVVLLLINIRFKFVNI